MSIFVRKCSKKRIEWITPSSLRERDRDNWIWGMYKYDGYLDHLRSLWVRVYIQERWWILTNQIKSNQIKSNQIKSNQIKSNQISLIGSYDNIKEWSRDPPALLKSHLFLWIKRKNGKLLIEVMSKTNLFFSLRDFSAFPQWTEQEWVAVVDWDSNMKKEIDR